MNAADAVILAVCAPLILTLWAALWCLARCMLAGTRRREPAIIGQKVVSKPGAVIEVTRLELSRAARKRLTTGVRCIPGAVVEPHEDSEAQQP